MVKKTTDLIKILPFEEGFKKDLLEVYDKLEPEKKYNIGMLLWSAYDVLFQMKFKENMAVALEEANENREKLDEGFYRRIRDLTDNEMANISAEDIKSADMSAAREKLQEIITDKN